ncbi:MAG TPA: hypothetical protein VLV31_01275 [Candidatus Acidoferrales bacterium]|nr:hypothetical protein [Candidatus Acidoferrales bacterium]
MIRLDEYKSHLTTCNPTPQAAPAPSAPSPAAPTPQTPDTQPPKQNPT